MKLYKNILGIFFTTIIISACSTVADYEKLESLPNGVYTSVEKGTITIIGSTLTINDLAENNTPIDFSILDLAFYQDLSTDQEYTLALKEGAETSSAKVTVSYGYSSEETPQEIIITFRGRGYGLIF